MMRFAGLLACLLALMLAFVLAFGTVPVTAAVGDFPDTYEAYEGQDNLAFSQYVTMTSPGALEPLQPMVFPIATSDDVLVMWRPEATILSFPALYLEDYDTAVRPSSNNAENYGARLRFMDGGTYRTLAWGSGGIHAGNNFVGRANLAWWQTTINTAGASDIVVEWRMRSTNTGPGEWQLQYSAIGGTNPADWNNVGGEIRLPSNPDASTLNQPQQIRQLPPTAVGHSTLHLRWIMVSNMDPLNSDIVAPGTHQINDIIIREGIAPVTTATVGTQVGTLTAGTAGTVTFPVTTAHIADGTYGVIVENLPTGVSVVQDELFQAEVVTIAGNTGTLTLAGSTLTVAGTTNTLTLYIDAVTSPAFNLVVEVPGAIPVTSITVTGANDATTITTNNGTLQMSAAVLPIDATNPAITWSVIPGTGSATISNAGLLTAVTDGTVTARATANDGSGVYVEVQITISGQQVAITNFTVNFNLNGGIRTGGGNWYRPFKQVARQ